MKNKVILKVIDNKNETIEVISKDIIDIGFSILAFSKYKLDFDNGVYYYKNTIQEALSNLKKTHSYIYQAKRINTICDDGSKELLDTILNSLEDLFSTLSQYKNEDFYIYADYKSHLSLYKNRIEELKPSEKIVNATKRIAAILKGCYNGTCSTKKERESAIDKRDKVVNLLNISTSNLSFIVGEGNVYNPEIIKIGDKQIFKFLVDLKVQEKSFIEKPNVEEYLLEVKDILRDLELGYANETNTAAYHNKLKKGIIQIWFYCIK